MNAYDVISIYMDYKNIHNIHIGGSSTPVDGSDMAIINNYGSSRQLEEFIDECLICSLMGGITFIVLKTYNDIFTVRSISEKHNNVFFAGIDTKPCPLYIITNSKLIDGCNSSELYDPLCISWIRDRISTKHVSGPVDIVYSLADYDNNNNYEELKLSLRSIDINAKDVGTVWIVSDKLPNWIDNVRHIKTRDYCDNCKDINIINKILTACSHPGLSDRFIFMSDDQIINQPIKISEIIPAYNDRGIKYFMNHKNPNRWIKRMVNTLNIVDAHGGDASINWDSHVPQPMDKNRFIDTILRLPYTILPGMCINTAYFGCTMEPAILKQDCIKHTFESNINNDIVLDKPFIGYNDKGYNSGLRDILMKKYCNMSIYEKDK